MSDQEEKEESLGRSLRRVREEQGLSLSEAAKAVRLQPSLLEAIEESRWKDLPGDAYARGFLTSLARQYNLDREEILSRYAAETGQHRKQSEVQLPFDDGIPHSGKHSRSSFLIVLTGIAVALALYSNFDERKQREVPAAPQLTDAEREEISPVEPESEELLRDDSESADESEILDEAFDIALSSDGATPIEETAPPPARPSSPVSTSTAPPSEKKTSRLKISCVKDSAWIEIRYSADSTWAVWVRENGPTYTRTHTDTMVIRTGHGERLLYELNGEKVHPTTPSFAIFNGQWVRSL